MLSYPYLEESRERIRQKKDKIADSRDIWVQHNRYYYSQIVHHLKNIIPGKSSILHIGCSTGFILADLNPSFAIGVEDSPKQISIAQDKGLKNVTFISQNPEQLKLTVDRPFEYVLVSSMEDIVDIKAVLDALRPYVDRHTRVILVNYNYLWNPVVMLAEFARLKIPQELHNWISPKDVTDLLNASNFESVARRNVVLFPLYIPLISSLLNIFLARLPLFRCLPLIQLTVARSRMIESIKDYSISVVIPCRNEAGNIESAVIRMPEMGVHTEIVFCDDKSTDGTRDKIMEMIAKFPQKDIKLVNGPGICKSQNVWAGFARASGDILMILDADLTVMPEELPYFYEAMAHDYGEFINGSRLVYPMEGGAMRLFNVIGNKFFSVMFSYILDTPLKDTLCGTKVLWRKDYERDVKRLQGMWGADRWGDYDLIFGAVKAHRKIIELPVHYVDRMYGETKMTNRIKNGLIMLKMTLRSLFDIKFY